MFSPQPASTKGNAISSTEFPYFQCASVLGTLTVLLSFTGVYLPASTSLFTTLPPQQSSRDKPQHPLLVPITASPVWTMIWLCAGVAVCQGWWGGWMRSWWAVYPRLGWVPRVEKKDDEEDKLLRRTKESADKIKDLRNACANTLFISALYSLVIIAMGAPITSHLPQTYLLSLFLSILTVFVPSYTLSLPTTSATFFRYNGPVELRWLSAMRLFGQRRMETAMERALVYPVIAALVGSWLGAFPIALDWDRPWQAWPLTSAYGALAGYLIGSWSAFSINTLLFFASQDKPQEAAVSSAPASRGTVKKQQGKK